MNREVWRLGPGLLSAAVTITAWAQSGGQVFSLQSIGGALAPAQQTVICTAREFITMDPERPRAEAIAVRDGRLVAVGTRAEVVGAAGNDIQVWGTMLEGRVQPVTPVPAAKSNDRGSPAVAAEQGGEVQRAVVGQLANLLGRHHSD